MQYLIDRLQELGLFPPWLSLVLLGSQLLALLTVPSVLLQREGRPRAALAWLLALFAAPMLGLVSWWAFGRTSIERKRRKRAARARTFNTRRGRPHTESGTPFEDLLPDAALGDSVFTTNGNRVELLLDGKEAFPEMERTIREAKVTLYVMFYIFRNDETGRRFRDLLVERAKAGVRVRVLVDAWGSPRFTGRFAVPLREAGVHVAAFLPSHFMPIQAPRLNFANHRKMIVADGRVAIVGGMNIGDEYVRRWRDLMARIEGPAVRAIEHVFLDDWFFASDEEILHGEHFPGKVHGDAACAVVASGPDRASFIHDTFFVVFTRAEQRIWIVTPYFIPTDALATALRTAANRGIDVRIVLPSRSDIGVVAYAARSFYPDLVQAGVKVYEYEGEMLHGKAIVVDDDLTVVGSANVDTRSFRLSFEISCFFKSRSTCTRLANWVDALMGSSKEITLEQCLNRSTAQKLLQATAHLFSPLL